ncbi:MAG: ABC transporter permease [Acidobacteriota bacterium]
MFWDTLRSDLRVALRQMTAAPLYAALSIVALALGVGAVSAIFTVANAVLLRPLPYADADRLVLVWSHNTAEGRPRNPLSPANFRDFQRLNQTLAALESYYTFVTPEEVRLGGANEIAYSVIVTPGLFDLLGRTPALGRGLAPGGALDAIVLSHGYWQRRFGGDPGIVGRTFEVGGVVRTVVGVMPADFVFPYGSMLGPAGFTRVTGVDFWAPMTFEGPLAARFRMLNAQGELVRNVHWLGAVGRMKPGVSVADVNADLRAIAQQLAQAYPASNTGWTATVVTAHEQTVGSARPALVLLLAGVGFILLMAAVNVANLVLARGVARQRELATRVALGAGQTRLLRQMFTESLLLAVAGGALGVLLARAGVQMLVALAPADLPRLDEIALDWRVVAVTAAVTVVTGVLVGMLPAVSAARTDAHATLQDHSRGAIGGRSRRRMRSALVVAEVALAVLLTTGTALFLRSFLAVLDVDPGFRPEGLLTWQINVPDRHATPEARRTFYAEFFERLEALPGVVAAGGTTRLPLGSTSVTTTIDIEGRPRPVAELPEVEFRRALHRYFEAMGIPVIRGRGFDPTDGPDAPPVVVINQTMARRLFPGEDPVGRRVRTGPDPERSPWMTVVGVIGDVRHTGLEDEPAPEMYISGRQGPPGSPFIVMRTTGDPGAVVDLVRAEARAIDDDLPIYELRTMEQVRSEAVAGRRFVLLVVGAFGLLALVLAAVGVYGVMALVVTERTAEVGMRLALGAEPRQVVSLVVGQAARLATAGVLVGGAAATALTPLMASQLYGIGPMDPVSMVGGPLALLVVAIVAAALPARRAMAVNPVEALRT